MVSLTARSTVTVSMFRANLGKLKNLHCASSPLLLFISPANRSAFNPFIVFKGLFSPLSRDAGVSRMDHSLQKVAGYGQDISNSILGIPRAIRLDDHDIMKFVAANTTIPVPKIYETKFDEEQNTFYIIMDYMCTENRWTNPRNILVNEDGDIAAVLDWEWAGWFPEYWDVVQMFTDLPSKKQMPEYAKHLRSSLSH
ncbi:hypothetical protein I7I51_00351 [Histoplasma capsulatum]|uniref:Aminoglycoside phosphotransferase domain-containing protein n=1 Tax=Ajellomyces capsulatus TaxID=5037 RepID=A0A8A1MF90_AJECA|nr:hypothetical protein I7I51_00351 [Histoplasma capsulatum]